MNSVSTTDTLAKDRDYAGRNTSRLPPDTTPLVHVQPPRREDLQPSYASVIKPDTEDASQHGWYGEL